MDKTLHYWGDIDTHGFAILSRLRGYWPHTRPFLMDRDTLIGHRELWGEESQERRCLHDLAGLNADEQALYDDLRCDRLGARVRLEQERIDYARVREAVALAGGQEDRVGRVAASSVRAAPPQPAGLPTLAESAKMWLRM